MNNRSWATRFAVILFVLFLMANLSHSQVAHAERFWPTYQIGSSGENVVTIQYMLRAYGYDLTPDGSFGPYTAGAVQQLQTYWGLYADGVVNDEIWERLIVTSSQGDQGDQVTALQRQLNALYSLLTVDSSFGSDTAESVTTFQETEGLANTGYADIDTWNRLVLRSVTLTHTEAVNQLAAAGIPATNIVSSNGCSDRNTAGCTSLDGVRQDTIDNIINFKYRSGCDIIITAGTEVGHSTSGLFTHANGYKLDIRRTDCVTNFITNNFQYAGLRESDQAPKYLDYAPAYWPIYADEGDHWDIVYY